ncbi:MAG: hypothetical protein HOQ05_05985 [Corynebacteriales bacterium]|nr:hypothetical protein [Mycobacteriales bacterium]
MRASKVDSAFLIAALVFGALAFVGSKGENAAAVGGFSRLAILVLLAWSGFALFRWLFQRLKR